MRMPAPAILAMIFCFISTPMQTAEAKVTINIGISINKDRKLTCREGQRLLRLYGFRDIVRLDCNGRFYVYRGLGDRGRYEITLRAANGRVVDLRRIRY
jgi:hypothetical protein